MEILRPTEEFILYYINSTTYNVFARQNGAKLKSYEKNFHAYLYNNLSKLCKINRNKNNSQYSK